MGNIPYYGLQAGNVGSIKMNPVVDQYAGAREGLNAVQKFVEQREAVQTDKLIAKSRSDLNRLLMEQEKEKGLDAEGFTSTMNQNLIDYENELLSSVPYSQRDKASSQFATIKYDLINKAGLYETKALAEKMTNDVKDSIDYNANTILSDYTQRQSVIDSSNLMIDKIDANDSVKDALRKEADNKYAIAEIKALTDLDAEKVLGNLEGGLYDTDITPEQKAAAMISARNKIKSNKNEEKLRVQGYWEETFNEDMRKVMLGEYDRLDLDDLRIKYQNNNKLFNALLGQFNSLEEKGFYLQQTQEAMNEGTLDSSTKAGKAGLDMLYRKQTDSLDLNTNDGKEQAQFFAKDIIDKTGFIPSDVANQLSFDAQSPDYKVASEAGKKYYDMVQLNPQIKSNLSESQAEKLYVIGAAIESGYDAVKAVDMVRVIPNEGLLKEREKIFNKWQADGKLGGSLNVDDDVAHSRYVRTFQQMFNITGDKDLSEKIASDEINRNYAYNTIGSGEAGAFEFDGGDVKIGDSTFRTKKVAMYQGPMQVYAPLLNGKNKDNAQELFANDLYDSVNGLIEIDEGRDIDYNLITIYNDNKHINVETDLPMYRVFYNGSPIYNEDGTDVYWAPKIDKYLSQEKKKNMIDKIKGFLD